MKGALHDDIRAYEAAVTQILKNISLEEMKEPVRKLVDRSKRGIK